MHGCRQLGDHNYKILQEKILMLSAHILNGGFKRPILKDTTGGCPQKQRQNNSELHADKSDTKQNTKNAIEAEIYFLVCPRVNTLFLFRRFWLAGHKGRRHMVTKTTKASKKNLCMLSAQIVNASFNTPASMDEPGGRPQKQGQHNREQHAEKSENKEHTKSAIEDKVYLLVCPRVNTPLLFRRCRLAGTDALGPVALSTLTSSPSPVEAREHSTSRWGPTFRQLSTTLRQGGGSEALDAKVGNQ